MTSCEKLKISCLCCVCLMIACTLQKYLVDWIKRLPAACCIAVDLEEFIENAAQGRETDCIEIFKSQTEGLGFSVVGLRSEHRGDLGIFVQVRLCIVRTQFINTTL